MSAGGQTFTGDHSSLVGQQPQERQAALCHRAVPVGSPKRTARHGGPWEQISPQAQFPGLGFAFEKFSHLGF